MPATYEIRTQVSSMTRMLYRPEHYHLHHRGGGVSDYFHRAVASSTVEEGKQERIKLYGKRYNVGRK